MQKESSMHDPEVTRLGQIAYAAYHRRPLPIDADEWPADDKIVQRWEAVGRALRDAIKTEPAVQSGAAYAAVDWTLQTR
jgi:hypothetical protein